jgi:hypothetical protein
VCWLQSDLFDFDQRSVVGVVVVVVEVADGFVVGVGVFVGGLALVPVVCVVCCVVCVGVVVCVCRVCVCVCVCCQTVSPSKLLSKLQVSDHEPHRERCIHNNYC